MGRSDRGGATGERGPPWRSRRPWRCRAPFRAPVSRAAACLAARRHRGAGPSCLAGPGRYLRGGERVDLNDAAGLTHVDQRQRASVRPVRQPAGHPCGAATERGLAPDQRTHAGAWECWTEEPELQDAPVSLGQRGRIRSARCGASDSSGVPVKPPRRPGQRGPLALAERPGPSGRTGRAGAAGAGSGYGRVGDPARLAPGGQAGPAAETLASDISRPALRSQATAHHGLVTLPPGT